MADANSAINLCNSSFDSSFTDDSIGDVFPTRKKLRTPPRGVKVKVEPFLLSTSEDHARKVPHNRKKVQTPTKVRVKVEPNASMSAPAAIGKNKKRTSAWNKGSIEHGAIRLFHEDDSLCDDMYQTKLYIDEKKVSMPRKLTVVERKKLNCGLCEHLRAHAYWLKLNATSATEERNRWNSSSLRAIASMIKTQAEETLLNLKKMEIIVTFQMLVRHSVKLFMRISWLSMRRRFNYSLK